jgi:hypothetical protein
LVALSCPDGRKSQAAPQRHEIFPVKERHDRLIGHRDLRDFLQQRLALCIVDCRHRLREDRVDARIGRAARVTPRRSSDPARRSGAMPRRVQTKRPVRLRSGEASWSWRGPCQLRAS